MVSHVSLSATSVWLSVAGASIPCVSLDIIFSASSRQSEVSIPADLMWLTLEKAGTTLYTTSLCTRPYLFCAFFAASARLGSARQSESDPSERCLCRNPLRYSIEKSVAPRTSDDGVPVPPSRFSKIHDGAEGWAENLIEDWLTFVNRGVLGPLHRSEAATAHVCPQRDLVPLLVNSGLCEYSLGCFFFWVRLV